MNRLFERKNEESMIAPDYKLIEKIKVGVTGIGKGVGTSFVATSIAYFTASESERNVAFVQLDEGHRVYDSLGIDKRFSGRNFCDFYKFVREGKNIKNERNLDEKINWALAIPESLTSSNSIEKRLTDVECMRLVNNIRGDFIVCDFGSCDNSVLNTLYDDMDYILCVLDPLPSKLLSAEEGFKRMKMMASRGKSVFFIVNKDNPGINRRELKDYLGKIVSDNCFYIRMFDQRLFYSAEYRCEIPASLKEIGSETGAVISTVLNAIL
ncbi:MAG: hypothetical protein IJP24_07275 [Firmicutes bacterium]|nr:hypothetical protein [Bacillota bacterium]